MATLRAVFLVDGVYVGVVIRTSASGRAGKKSIDGVFDAIDAKFQYVPFTTENRGVYSEVVEG